MTMSPVEEREYQLVLEFIGDSPDELQRVVALEDKMTGGLTSGIVDGNDVGNGVVNIFIVTKAPQKCFAEAFSYVEKHNLRLNASGFRDFAKTDYVRLWPKEEKRPFVLR